MLGTPALIWETCASNESSSPDTGLSACVDLAIAVSTILQNFTCVASSLKKCHYCFINVLVQVFQVQQQMANLKMQQGQQMMNGGYPLQPQRQSNLPPGQTLNPDLW